MEEDIVVAVRLIIAFIVSPLLVKVYSRIYRCTQPLQLLKTW
jgi:hypothetical protein